MIYREYAKANNPGITDEKIEEMVGGLFGADAEMGEPIEVTNRYDLYRINGYLLYSNNSACDTVQIADAGSDVAEEWAVEEWFLDY